MKLTGKLTWMARRPASARGDQRDQLLSATYPNGQASSSVYENEVK